jgi:hypothetical protein
MAEGVGFEPITITYFSCIFSLLCALFFSGDRPFSKYFSIIPHRVYLNISGQKAATFFLQVHKAQDHTLNFSGSDSNTGHLRPLLEASLSCKFFIKNMVRFLLHGVRFYLDILCFLCYVHYYLEINTGGTPECWEPLSLKRFLYSIQSC